MFFFFPFVGIMFLENLTHVFLKWLKLPIGSAAGQQQLHLCGLRGAKRPGPEVGAGANFTTIGFVKD